MSKNDHLTDLSIIVMLIVILICHCVGSVGAQTPLKIAAPLFALGTCIIITVCEYFIY